jgi:hypothetical protein
LTTFHGRTVGYTSEVSRFIWQCRYPDGSFELHCENLTGSMPPPKGTRIEIDGLPWRVKDVVAIRQMIRISLQIC